MAKDQFIEVRRLEQVKALSNEARIKILIWLDNPSIHFANQETGDPNDIGVCVTLIAKKLKISQPTTSRHLEILKRAGLLELTKVQMWSFFKRNEKEITNLKRWLTSI